MGKRHGANKWGDCCCNCIYLRKIYVCSCEHCSKVKGWVCIYDPDNLYSCRHHEEEHGICEGHVRREKTKNTIIIESTQPELLKVKNYYKKIIK